MGVKMRQTLGHFESMETSEHNPKESLAQSKFILNWVIDLFSSGQ